MRGLGNQTPEHFCTGSLGRPRLVYVQQELSGSYVGRQGGSGLGLEAQCKAVADLLDGGRAGLRKSELIDIDDPRSAMWRLPSARSKNGREHVIPLAPLAVSIVKEALSLAASGVGSDYVFQSPRNDQPITAHALAVAMARVAKRLGSDADDGNEIVETAAMDAWRNEPPAPHDLRRTAATRMRALGISSDDVKRVLNHAPTSVLGRHYDYYDALPEKRRALETWPRELKRIIGADASD